MGFDAFEGIENVTISNRTRWFEPGNYLCKVENVKYHESNNPIKAGAVYFTVEFSTIESTVEDMQGASLSWTRDIGSSGSSMNLADVRAFMAASAGVPIDAVDREFASQAVSENLLVGRTVKVEAWEVETKSGGTFTKTKFTTAG